jgi:hypothetical protein
VVLWRGIVVHSSPVGGLRGRAWGRSRGQRVRLDLRMAMRRCDSSSDSLFTSLILDFLSCKTSYTS